MISGDDKVLVAVSGGKDSLAVWDILTELGYRADGLYVGLGIGEYSDRSREFAENFAHERQLDLHVVDLREQYSFDIPTAAKATHRVPCSACGTSKRHVFDQFALSHGYNVVATGHNLDDEVAVLFGNTLRWDVDYLARQLPVLPPRPGFPKKIKPLVRLSEREMAAWCVVRNIDYIIEECPMAAGNRHLRYKEAMNMIEGESPGTKSAFYLGFLERMAPIIAAERDGDEVSLNRCPSCDAPTTSSGPCAFCRIRDKAASIEPVEVDIRSKRQRRAAT